MVLGARLAVEALSRSERRHLERFQLILVDERLSGKRNTETLRDHGLFELGFTGSQLHIPEEPLVKIDLVILGIGEDGHFASLFPGSCTAGMMEGTAPVIEVTDAPKPPRDRVSISYQGFKTYASQARYVLLFFGSEKHEALRRFIAGEDCSTLPCAFIRDTMEQILILTDLEENEL